MMNLAKRLMALVMVLALAIPVIAISEEAAPATSTLIDASLNQTEFNKGDTLVLTWSFDTTVVELDSMHVDFKVTHSETFGDIEFAATAYMNTFIRDQSEGVFTMPIDGSIYGQGYMKFSYREKFSSSILTQTLPLTINRPADAEPYFDFSVSKHPGFWQTGDVIDFSWDCNVPSDAAYKEFGVAAYNGNISIVGEPLSATEPGAYQYTVPDTKSVAMFVILMNADSPYVEGAPDYDTSYSYSFLPGYSPVPSEEPTAAPSEQPTAEPTATPAPDTTPAPTSAPGKKVELNLDSITVGAKQTVDTVKVVEGSVVTWTSANEKVAKVDADGKITGVKKGKTVITAADGEGNSDSVEVTIVAKNKGVKKIKLSKKKATLKQGEKLTLKATLTPSDAKNKKVIWTSSNTAVVTVSAKGKVKAVGVGEAVITATASSGKTATCKITVTGAKVKKITIEGSKKMKVGDTQTLIAKISPEYAENKAVKWKSSAKKIATVDENGVVTALKKGTVKITATAKDGSKVKAVFTIKIKK